MTARHPTRRHLARIALATALILGVTPRAAWADLIIHDVFGAANLTPSSHAIPENFNPIQVTEFNGTVYAVGEATDGKPAVFSVRREGNQLSDPQFEILEALSGPGGSGRVNTILEKDGKVAFAGNSQILGDNALRMTVWKEGTPSLLEIAGNTGYSEIRSSSGRLKVGQDQGGSLAFVDETGKRLPIVGRGTAAFANVALDNGIILGGDLTGPVWWDHIGPLENMEFVRKVPTAGGYFGLEIPGFTYGVSDDLGNAFGLSSFEDSLTGEILTGIWDIVAGGNPLQTWNGSLADVYYYEDIDITVVALNRLDGGYLGTFGHDEVMGTGQIPGLGFEYNPPILRGGLWEGSIGLFLNGPNNTLIATSNNLGPASAVPEPSSLVLALLGLLGLLSIRTRLALRAA